MPKLHPDRLPAKRWLRDKFVKVRTRPPVWVSRWGWHAYKGGFGKALSEFRIRQLLRVQFPNLPDVDARSIMREIKGREL